MEEKELRMKDSPSSPVVTAMKTSPWEITETTASTGKAMKNPAVEKARATSIATSKLSSEDTDDESEFQDAADAFDSDSGGGADGAQEETVEALLKNLGVSKLLENEILDDASSADSSPGTPTMGKPASKRGSAAFASMISAKVTTSRLSKREAIALKNEATDDVLLLDILEVEKSLDLFLNSQFKEAESLLLPKYGRTMYTTQGVALLRMLRAVMTFDPDDMSMALESLGFAAEVASVLRRQERSSVLGMLSGAASMVTGSKEGGYLAGMTRVQKHAELIFAECSILQSLLSLISNTNIVSFIKEGMQLRSSFSVIKSCFRFLERIYEEEGIQGYANHSIDEHFTSGIIMSAGMFALTLSFLPSKAIKVFELIGYIGDRDIALDRLSTAAEWPFSPSIFVTGNPKHKFKQCFPTPVHKVGTSGGLRKAFAELMLFAYHIVLSSLNPLPDCNLPLARSNLNLRLHERQGSFIYRALRARLLETEAKPEEAEAEYNVVVSLQKDYQQLYHACLWDMGICRMAQRKWEAAYEGYDLLFRESKWTRAVYRYASAVTLYSQSPADPRVSVMMAEIPSLIKKIAGMTIPLEKFISRKSRKFLAQGNRLLFPSYEILYFFHGLVMMHTNTLKEVVQETQAAIADLEKQKSAKAITGDSSIPYDTYYDDLCLALFIQAIALREIGYPTSLTYVDIVDQVTLGRVYKLKLNSDNVSGKVSNIREVTPEDVESLRKSISSFQRLLQESSNILLDHWMLIFGRYELGSLYLRVGDFEAARREFNAAQNKGVAEGDGSQTPRVKKASLETMLSVRCHNALLKLKALEETSKITA